MLLVSYDSLSNASANTVPGNDAELKLTNIITHQRSRLVVLINGPWVRSQGRAGQVFLEARPKSPCGLRLG